MPKIFFRWFIFFGFVLSQSIYSRTTCAQETNSDTIQTTDTTTTLDDSFNFVMLDFTFTNNKQITREQASENTPAFIGDFSFLHKSGIYSGLNYTSFFNTDTTSYDLEFTFGYQKDLFNDKFDLDINYNYHKYKGVDDYKGIDYNHTLNLNIGYTYKIMRMYADADIYLDNENYFTEFGVSNTIDFDNVFTQGDFIFIQPTISVGYGTDYWLYDIYKDFIENNINYFKYYLYNRGYQVVDLDAREAFDLYLESQGINSNTFTYQGLDFMIPITYGYGSVSLTLAWMYSIPSDKLKFFGLTEQSGYIVSLSFIF